ncbi:DUF4235 domain-containing protein [Kribbia dieselivorans]|uniref:DUF4235 domain-containing protein n=1 Tax=Kribbia dieselivorans TaxID=331526 RepID=UPI000837F71D|nr:DUF4235 domain-containing protein [Kribbia dieselivorans]
MGNLVWKILGAGGAVLAGIVANKAAEKALGFTGRDLTVDPQDPDSPLVDAIFVILVTGTVAALARMFVQREMAKAYRRSTGHLPPAVAKARAKHAKA